MVERKPENYRMCPVPVVLDVFFYCYDRNDLCTTIRFQYNVYNAETVTNSIK